STRPCAARYERVRRSADTSGAPMPQSVQFDHRHKHCRRIEPLSPPCSRRSTSGIGRGALSDLASTIDGVVQRDGGFRDPRSFLMIDVLHRVDQHPDALMSLIGHFLIAPEAYVGHVLPHPIRLLVREDTEVHHLEYRPLERIGLFIETRWLYARR